MIDFEHIFQDEYQFTLKHASYNWLPAGDAPQDAALNIKDNIRAEQCGNQIEITYSRSVFFEPNSIFDVTVVFAFILVFSDEAMAQAHHNIVWEQALLEQENPYMANIISRASSLIASITASYGQQPLVTPPNFVG